MDDLKWMCLWGDVINLICNTYEELKKLPRPEAYKMGGTFYGSTELFTSVGNMLELIEGEPYISHEYGGDVKFPELWGIRIGGAYKEDISKKLKEFLKEHEQEFRDEGYSYINKYGTNFSVIGIARFR